MFKKIFSTLWVPYAIIYVLISMAKKSSQFKDVDFSFLMISNVFFALLTGCIIYFVSKSAQSSNPHAFVRGVMGGMLAKMMITALAFIIAMPWVKNLHTTEILLCMFIYLIYLIFEVWSLTATQKKKDVVES